MKSFGVLLLVLSASFYAYAATVQNTYIGRDAVADGFLTLSAGASVNVTVNVTDTSAYGANWDTVLGVKIDLDKMEDLTISIEAPTGEKKDYFTGLDKSICNNCPNGDFFMTRFEKFIDRTENSWTCRNKNGQKCITEYIKQVQSFSTIGCITGDWIVTFTNNGDKDGKIWDVSISIGEDIDMDEILNDDDSCPYNADPNNSDLNEDGVGDVCECNYWNHHVPSGFERQCILLDHFAVGDAFYKGERRNPGDWWPVVVRPAVNPSFQPGDYNHKSEWLDCKCATIPYEAQVEL